MIQLECSNCKTMLSIDDAFAGGVCRCQFCGTIQTVPRPSSAAAQTADVGSPKALFRRKARIESALSPYNDDLDRAADQMESSGALSPNAFSELSRSSKRSSSPASPGDSAAGTSPVGKSQAESPSPRRTATTSSGAAAAGAAMSRPAGATTAPERARAAAGQPHFVPKPSSSTAASRAGASSKTPLIIAAAAVGVLVCGGGLWFALSGGSKSDPTPTPAQVVPAPEAEPVPAVNPDPASEPKATPAPVVGRDPAAAPAPVVVVEPAPAQVQPGEAGSFAGISLGGASVVYILDRGGRTSDEFQQILDACYRSVESLGQQRKFALILWNDAQGLTFPQEELAAASAANVDACRKLIANSDIGFADIDPVLAKALTKKPEDIVLVSAMDMDDLTATAIRDQLAKAGAPVRFHGIAVGSNLAAERLRALAVDHGGQFKQADAAALK